MNPTPYGYRILGSTNEERRLVIHAVAFVGYASCDERAEVGREAYLSAFMFGDDFRELLQERGSVRGFEGTCWSPWLWFDIDRVDLDSALQDVRRLAHYLVDRYQLNEDAMLMFFSGSKGFHLGLPTSLWGPDDPSTSFHCVCRRLAEGIAEKAGVVIDTGVYDRVRAFRAPNSRHPKTGLHKRRLSLDELTGLSLEGIRLLASKPAPFELPNPPPICEQAKTDWASATDLVEREAEGKSQRRVNVKNGTPSLNRQFFEILRDGIPVGDRHRSIFSAAANLAEFACPPTLAHALLTEPGLDSGLSPSDVRRQIDCGLAHGQAHPSEGPPSEALLGAIPSSEGSSNADELRKQLAKLWSGSTTTPIVEPIPDTAGDAWEPPADRLGNADQATNEFLFGANALTPYDMNGGRL